MCRRESVVGQIRSLSTRIFCHSSISVPTVWHWVKCRPNWTLVVNRKCSFRRFLLRCVQLKHWFNNLDQDNMDNMVPETLSNVDVNEARDDGDAVASAGTIAPDS